MILIHYFLVFRFVPEWLFINPWFHTGLFLVHALLLLAAAKYFWHLLKEYAKLNAMSQKPAVAIQLFLLPLFLSNFIGIVAARSLHYQVSTGCHLFLTHNMAMIQPSFTSSKWNMGEILQFFVKSGLEKIFLKFLPEEAIFSNSF